MSYTKITNDGIRMSSLLFLFCYILLLEPVIHSCDEILQRNCYCRDSSVSLCSIKLNHLGIMMQIKGKTVHVLN